MVLASLEQMDSGAALIGAVLITVTLVVAGVIVLYSNRKGRRP